MSPFNKGFVRLGEFYFEQTGREVRVGKPVMRNPYAQPASERLRIKHVLEWMIREMLAGMNRKAYLCMPLHR